MDITRRDVNRLLLLGTLGAAAGTLGVKTALASPSPVRMPLKEFVLDADRVKGLRRGVAEMKKRKASDPLSWFFQAAIHGVPPFMAAEAAKRDPDVAQVDQARLWNQCPHRGQNSANFLPWHRGYTHHFEQILRMHVGDESFALPYWDYADPTQRNFPREFGIQHLNGVLSDNSDENINPLFHNERDFFLCKYEHPFTSQLPLTELSSRAVDDTRVMSSPIFFGILESEGIGGAVADADSATRGLMEQAPHDQIHRVVGGRVDAPDAEGTNTAVGSMAIPVTAGFDPIFCVHHANMDRLWAKWSAMPGKSWGTLPPREWFDEKPWFFFDTDGKEVNRPRRDYFDYRALGVAFQDEDPNATPLPLPADIAPAMDHAMMAAPEKPLQMVNAMAFTAAIEAPPTGATNIRLSSDVENSSDAIVLFRNDLRNAAASEAVTLTLRNIGLADLNATGFDVFLVGGDVDEAALTPADPGYLGPISMFNHAAADQTFDQTFDLSAAMAAMDDTDLSSLRVVLVPYPLTTGLKSADLPVAQSSGPLRAAGVVLTRQPRNVLTMGASPQQHMHN